MRGFLANKFNVLTSMVLMMTMAFFFMGIGYQIHEKKQQILCHTHLQHWGTAFHIYYHQQKKHWQLGMNDNREKWVQTVCSYLYSFEITQCPATMPGSNCHTYKLNADAAPQVIPGFANTFPGNIVLLFDGISNVEIFNTHRPAYREIANRHLGGPNILFLDGSVLYRSARAEGLALDEVGWQNSGGYLWHLYPPHEKSH